MEVVTKNTIETEPGFSQFMDFMLESSQLHSETLTDAADIIAADEDLVLQKGGGK